MRTGGGILFKPRSCDMVLDDIGFNKNQKALFATQVPGCCGCLLLDVVVFRQLYEQEVQKGF